MTSCVEIVLKKNANDPNIVPATGWEGNVRSIDIQTWESGDVFTIVGDETIWKQKVGKKTDGSDAFAFFIVVPVTNPANPGVEVAKNFYPTSLTKSVFEYDRASKVRNLQRTPVTGTAVDFAKNYATVQELMDALKGKTIRISDVKQVYTLRYGADSSKEDSYMNSNLPKFDFVEG